MKITSEKVLVRTVEVRFSVEDLKRCLRFKDEDGRERGLPSDAVLSASSEGATTPWEVVVSFNEEVDEDGETQPTPASAALKNQKAVLAALANHANGRGMTDEQIVMAVKSLGVGPSPAKKARIELIRQGLVVKVGTRRGRGKSTGKPRTIYKVCSLFNQPMG
jgi:hypothetical protein